MWNFFKRLFGGGKRQEPQIDKPSGSAGRCTPYMTPLSSIKPKSPEPVKEDLKRPNGQWEETENQRPPESVWQQSLRREINKVEKRQRYNEILSQAGMDVRARRFEAVQQSVDRVRQEALNSATPQMSRPQLPPHALTDSARLDLVRRATLSTMSQRPGLQAGLDAVQRDIEARRRQNEEDERRRREADDEDRRRRNNDDTLNLLVGLSSIISDTVSSSSDSSPSSDPFSGGGGSFDGGGASGDWS
jgi:hypothetical protein